MTVDIKSSKNDYALSCTKHIAGKNSAGAGVTQTMGRGWGKYVCAQLGHAPAPADRCPQAQRQPELRRRRGPAHERECLPCAQ